MWREDIKALTRATPHELRKFGLTVGGVFLVLGLLFYVRHKPWWPWFAWLGAPLLLIGTLRPGALKWIYFLWMTLAMALGAIVSTTLLTLLFYLAVTPIGLLARLGRRDFLTRRLDPTAASYWILRDTSKAKRKHEHERQF